MCQIEDSSLAEVDLIPARWHFLLVALPISLALGSLSGAWQGCSWALLMTAPATGLWFRTLRLLEQC